MQIHCIGGEIFQHLRRCLEYHISGWLTLMHCCCSLLGTPLVDRYEDFALPLEPTDSPYYKDNQNYTVGMNYKAYKWADRTW